MVYALLAFLAGALASVLVLAVRERRRAAAMEEELERLRAEAAMLERRDADTGLWNSRHFVEALTREIERSRTYGPTERGAGRFARRRGGRRGCGGGAGGGGPGRARARGGGGGGGPGGGAAPHQGARGGRRPVRRGGRPPAGPGGPGAPPATLWR